MADHRQELRLRSGGEDEPRRQAHHGERPLPPGLPDTQLANGNQGGYKNTEVEFEIVNKIGSYRGAGANSPITGMGARVIIIDDPIKHAEQAASETYQDRTLQWYRQTLYTRQDWTTAAESF